jgi:spore coat protein CotH
MRIDKQFKFSIIVLITAAVGLIIILAFDPKTAGVVSGAHTLGYEKYFDEASVMTVDIVADDSEWENMLANAREEKYIRCDVVINGERIKNVGIRPKGNSSLLQVVDSGSKRFSF